MKLIDTDGKVQDAHFLLCSLVTFDQLLYNDLTGRPNVDHWHSVHLCGTTDHITLSVMITKEDNGCFDGTGDAQNVMQQLRCL